MREIRLLPEILPGCLVILFAGMLRSRFACSEQVAQVSSLRVNLMDKLEAYPTIRQNSETPGQLEFQNTL